ncbi:MAG: glycosyltransferase [Candidatus Omnitrophica bacterium]|nr:glycosyltransferase [Candidatus Omnitrophota bacterium]
MKRIAIVCTGLNELGGTNNHLKKIYHNLNKDKFEVFLVFCSSIKDELERILLSSGIKEEHLFVIPNVHKIRIFPLIWELKNYFKEKNIDIVHTFHIQSDIFGGIAAKLSGIKEVYSFFESKIMQESMSVVKMVFYKTMNVFIKCIFKKTLVVSNEIKSELIGMNFRNVHSIEVVHVGIDVPEDYLKRNY